MDESQLIEYSYHEVEKPNLEEEAITKLIRNITSDHEYRIGSISIVLCTDGYLLEINKSFLDHNYFTDIITFDLSDTPKTIDCELYISTDRVKENAFNLAVSFEKELYRVIIHGILHLVGFDDKDPISKEQMSKKEDYYLERAKI